MVVKLKGFVFSKWYISEVDENILLFTEKFGKLSCIARGSGLKTFSYPALLNKFILNEFIIFKSSRGNFILHDINMLEDLSRNIIMDVEKTIFSLYMIYLISSLIPYNQKEDELFLLFYKMLKFLNAEPYKKELYPILLWKMIFYSGLYPQFKRCYICKEEIPKGEIRYSINDGAVICNRCFTNSGNFLKLNKGLIQNINFIVEKRFNELLNLRLYDAVINTLEELAILHIRYHYHSEIESLKRYMVKI